MPRSTALTGPALALAVLLSPAAGADDGRELLAAAQRQDTGAVRELLAAGADVDAKSRYGATALFFACDKGHLELVKLLLEKGAAVDVTDTFYRATPLTWTLYKAADSPPHREIALLLLGRRPADAAAALEFGARRGDLEMVEAAIAHGEIEPDALRSSLAAAAGAGHREVAAYLEARVPAAEETAPPATVTPEPPASEPAPDAAPAASPAAPAAAPPLPAVERGEPIPWPRFRGRGAAGIGDGQGAPARWDGESGENVRWKRRIPGLAHASPIVWGGRIYLTSAVSDGGDESLRTGLYGDVDSVDDDSPHAWRVYALDQATGEVLWQRTAAEGRPKSKRHLKSTQANPTPVTDGKVVVAHFGSQGMYAYDAGGNLLWQKQQGTLASGWFFDSTYEWGFSSSPILHDGKVITQIDVEDGSFIAAYDLATGREVWKTGRDEIPTWGTPAVLPAAGGGGAFEIVTNGTTVRGYDAASGMELWRLGPNSEITVGSPVIAGGLAYVTGGYPPVRPIYAIRPGGRGDLTLPEGETSSAHVAWSTTRGGTYIPTPIVYRGLLYMLHNNGRLTAHDAATGEQIYRQRIGPSASFSSSPVAADGRLYFTSEEGTTFVVRAGEAFEILETNELGEVVMTTPAISDGLLVMRGARHLFGLAEEPGNDGAP